MHNAHYALGNGPILSAMYTMAYGRFGVDANLCRTSFAAANATGDVVPATGAALAQSFATANGTANGTPDRKSTRLNSSHLVISYAVFCLKKKNNECMS